MLADAIGRAVAFILAPGQAHELPHAVARLDQLPGVPSWVGGDRGYSSHVFQEYIRSLDAKPAIPTKGNEAPVARWDQEYRGYYAVAGHGMARRQRARLAKLLRHPALQEHVVARLREGWSPQQIAGRLRLDGHPAGYASHETIYRHIYGPVGREDRLYALTARGRRQRRTRFGRKPRAAHISTDQSIAACPPHIADRTEFGHWEGDLVMFGRRSGGGNITSLQERQSRFLMLVGNDDRRSAAVAAGINAVLTPLPASARRSITFDRGTEFMGYAALRPMQTWFCDPHSPWQKGGVENANGRLRRYLPIDSSIGERTPDALVDLTVRLNTTPRRCLGYRTPAEAFHGALAASAGGA